jgi:adenine-specific DNA-methyltransferase
MPIEKLKPSFSLTEERLRLLERVVPEAFVDGRINWETLREVLGARLEDDETSAEHFGLFWPGKRQARRIAAQPSTRALVPSIGEGVDEEKTENVFIEGDNLEILRLLQKSYTGRIKMVYIDPPYNTGNDFIYKDNFSDSLEVYLKKTNQIGEEGGLLTTNSKSDGRFHSNWLNMMYPRLRLASNLLKEDGVIFVSIDDNELHNLRQIMNEIFGEGNFVGIISWKNVTDNNPTLINKDNEFIVCYGKEKAELPQSWKSIYSEGKDLIQTEYERLKKHTRYVEKIQDGVRQFIGDNAELVGLLSRYKNVDENGVYTGSESVHNPKPGGYEFEIIHPTTKKPMRKPANGYRFPKDTFTKMDQEGQILYGDDEKRIVKIKKYLKDYEDTLRSVIVMDGRLGSYDLKRVFETDVSLFSNPKPVDLLLSLISFATEKNDGDIVADFFAGSATTAHAVYELNRRDRGNRKFILSQLQEATPENSPARKAGYEDITEIAKERMRRVVAKEAPITRGLPTELPQPDLGFRVFKLEKSNFKLWQDYDGGDIQQVASLLSAFDTPLTEGWGEQDVLSEILLIEGFPLSSAIEPAPGFTANKVVSVQSEFSSHQLFVCLEARIEEGTLDQIALMSHKDIFVCLDSALNDTAKVRLNDVGNVRTI